MTPSGVPAEKAALNGSHALRCSGSAALLPDGGYAGEATPVFRSIIRSYKAGGSRGHGGGGGSGGGSGGGCGTPTIFKWQWRRRTTDAHEDVDWRLAISGLDRARNVAIGDEADAHAGLPRLANQISMPRPVQNEQRDVPVQAPPALLLDRH